ncbi:Variant surface glycoprotein [Trypanosoma congolense IL3000]|uniref:Variant surface glycoprotein n=1 Tax=Trypanosoma congolense (strain IL3000) TaxID=1068625 RepID=F9W6M9_TRYCI|nr:Variant surface glycoprotein [Trypanosoma congolense IL3000]
MMKFLIVVMVVIGVVGADQVGGAATLTNHNEASHRALCDFLKVAVDKWKEVKTRGPTDPLRKALKDTIFGYGSGDEDMEALKSKLPRDYEEVWSGDLSSRTIWCGEQHEGYNGVNQARWSGHSAPHDMVCLCTVGNKGWPLNKSDATNPEKEQLCGKGPIALKAGDDKGWMGSKSGKEQIEATWMNVTVPCLNSNGQGNKLKEAFQKFKNTLGPLVTGDPTHQMLGEGNFSVYHGCDGSPKLGVCVVYFPNDKDTKPWWKDLEQAIKEDEEIKKRLADEEVARQKEQEKERLPRAEAVTSSPPDTQDGAQNKTDTLHDKLRKFNLTSGTPISRPSSWLLSAAMLI